MSERDDSQAAECLLPWGGQEFRPDELQPHSFIIGSPGSGKSVLLRMLMRAALLDWSDALRVRGFIYDGKREFYPLLRGMGVPRDKIHVLLPTDQRSIPWDIAADIDTLEDAMTLAKTLAPAPRGEREPFFITATQALLARVMFVLHCSRTRRWDLYDVVEAMRLPSRLDAVLQYDETSRAVYRQYVSEERQGAGVLSTISNNVIFAYETTATLWRRTWRRQKPLSLKQWVQTPKSGVLLMMPDPSSASVQPINQAMFRWIAQLLDARPELGSLGEGHETWMCLDEFRFAEELPLLDDLLAKGRSKGIRVSLASQTIEGIVDVYGEERTFDMLSNAANLAVLRLSRSPSTEKVAGLFGKNEQWEADHGESTTKNYKPGFWNWWHDSMSKSTSSNTKIVQKDVVLPSMLTDLPPAGPKNGIHGYFATPELGTWSGPIPWSFVLKYLRPADTRDEPFERRAPEDFFPLESGRAKPEKPKGDGT